MSNPPTSTSTSSSESLESSPRSDRRRLQTLYKVSTMVNQVTDGLEMERILQRVLRLATETLTAESGSIFVLDDNQELLYAWMIADGKTYTDESWPYLHDVLKDGLAGRIIETGRAVQIDNTATDDRWIPGADQTKENQPSMSVLGVPLVAGNRVTGTLLVSKYGEGQFVRDDLSLLEAIAEQVAHTIFNARLYAESQTYGAELQDLITATTAVSATLDVEKIMRQAALHMCRLGRMQIGILWEWDDKKGKLYNPIWHVGQDVSDPPLDLAKMRRLRHTPLLASPVTEPHVQAIYADRPQDADEEGQALLRDLEVQAAVLVPLVSQTHMVGAAVLLDRRRMWSISPRNLSVVQMIGNRAAVSLRHARLYEQSRHQLQVMQILNDASRMINSSLDLNEIMQSLLAQMNSLLQAEAISVALVEEESNQLVFTVAEGKGSGEIVGLRLPSNEGITGWVMQNAEPALVNDTTNDSRFTSRGDQRTGHVTRAMIVAPLTAKGKVLGTVQALNPIAKDSFSEEDMDLLVNLANLAGSAMANARQYEQTQQAEQRYMGLFQDSIDPIILTDVSGNIVEINDQACELLGHGREELMAMNIRHLHPVETGMLGQNHFRPIQSDQVKLFSTERLRTDKRNAVVEVYAKRVTAGISEESGTEKKLLQWLYHDITEQVELQQMRQDLTAMLFHDLQSPLGNVISSLEMLSMEVGDQEETREILQVATKSSRRLQRLVKSLLDINRLEEGHPIQNQSFESLRDLIDEAEESMKTVLDMRNIRVVRNVPIFVPDVYMDRDMIGRVIINLLDNALKYSSSNQKIAIRLSENLDTEEVTVSIGDQGPGISVEYRQVIFDKFRRMDDGSRTGIGLGLAFCRLAVEAHHGRIWVDDSQWGGARFNFTLPVTGGADRL